MAGSRSAGRAQERASAQATALQREIYDDTTERLDPFVGAGNNALSAYLFELGMGDQPEGYQGITLSPAAQFAMEQGRGTIESGAAASGGLFSGATAKGLEGFRHGIASQDRDNQLNRLLSLVQGGQSAASGQGAAGINFANQAGSNILAAGNAKAAGIVGGVNSINDAIGNYYGYQNFNRLMDLAG